MSASKGQGRAAPSKPVPAAAAAGTTAEKKEKAPAAAAAATPGKVSVHDYKRTDGTPVSKHIRRPPGVAQAEEKERVKREREEKKAAREKQQQKQQPPKKKAAVTQPVTKSRDHKDEGDWEENEEEGYDPEPEHEEQEQDEEAVAVDGEDEEEIPVDQQEGDEQQPQDEDGQPEEQPQYTEQKPRKMSMHEYLSMPWTSQQAVLIDKKLEQSKDSLAKTLVIKDAIAAARKSGSAAFADVDDGDDDQVHGYDAFLKAFDKAGNFNNGDRASVSRNLRTGKYHDGGEWGKRALVPHLYGAGMPELAKAVQVGKYKF